MSLARSRPIPERQPKKRVCAMSAMIGQVTPAGKRAAISSTSTRKATSSLFEPVLAVGLGAARAGAGERVRNLAEKHNLPVLLTPMAKGLLPEDHRCYTGVLFHALSDVVGLTHDLKALTSNLVAGRGTMGQLLTNPALYNQLENTLGRTNALLDHAYGPEFRYREVMSFPKGPRGAAMAYGVLGAMGALLMTLSFQPAKPPITTGSRLALKKLTLNRLNPGKNKGPQSDRTPNPNVPLPPNAPTFGHPVISGIGGFGYEENLRLDPTDPTRIYTSVPGSAAADTSWI